MKRPDFAQVGQSALESLQRCKELEESLGNALLLMQIGRQGHGIHDEGAIAVSATIEVPQRRRESILVEVTVDQAAMTRVSAD